MVARPTGIALAAAKGPPAGDKLVVIEEGEPRFGTIEDLPRELRAGDLVVLNDAATLPASLSTRAGGAAVELRLARYRGGDRWDVAVLGEGDWRVPTERRGPPPQLRPGQVLWIVDLRIEVLELQGPHLATVALSAPEGWLDALYRYGDAIRYSYLGQAVPLPAFQTAFATRPWAVESPSAALPLRWSVLLALRARGVQLATLTHAAGISSIDGGELDAQLLPLPERTDLPQQTVDAVLRARDAGRRVIAVGTTVVRALEGRLAAEGQLVAGASETTLKLDGQRRAQLVDGLLTKLHASTESHFDVLASFAPRETLQRAFSRAAARGFHNHEFGDSAFIVDVR
jgi:S-adenosylmethionine:tRNA ribosyltransferase-isomerase